MAAKIARATRYLALLRGINVGGNKKVPMATLRELAGKLGYSDVSSYIQSGNLLLTATASAAELTQALEQGIAKTFGFSVEVIVRTAAQWQAYQQPSFADAANVRPNLLLLGAAKAPVKAGCADELTRYAKAGERIAVGKDAIWIDFAAGVGKSKLTPAVIDRAAGSTVTMRNWTTVQTLAELLAAP
jgi:uncharacterized protein (DUF1697 family)